MGATVNWAMVGFLWGCTAAVAGGVWAISSTIWQLRKHW